MPWKSSLTPRSGEQPLLSHKWWEHKIDIDVDISIDVSIDLVPRLEADLTSAPSVLLLF